MERIEEEHLQNTSGAEINFEVDAYEENEEIKMEDLEQAPHKFKDMQPLVHDPMEEVNLGTMEELRITYISSLIPFDFKEGIVATLLEFKDCFALNYDKMPGRQKLGRTPLAYQAGISPISATTLKNVQGDELKVKKEIGKFLKAKFVIPIRYVQWLANNVPMMKNNGKLRVCVDFKNLNAATPKDMYVMPIANMLVDSTANNELLSFLDDFSRYNQILIAIDDLSKTAFRCPDSLRTFEWVVMPFSLKNAGATYQRVMNAIFYDMLGHHMEIYINDIVVKSKKATEHVNHLRKSFERMRLHQLILNPLKCGFRVQAEIFLGFLVQ